jgi:putative acetyltransferase
VRRGLEACRDLGYDCAVVLGEPEYYSRFGFRTASEFGLRCEYDVPVGAFMAMELRPGALQNIAGTVIYQDEFRDF